MSSIYHALHGAPVIHPWRSAGGYTVEGYINLLVDSPDGLNWKDFVGQMIGRALIDLGSHPIEPLVRVYPSRGPFDRIVVQGDKPNATTYDGSLDWRRYGSFLDSALTAGRVLSGGLPSNLFRGREHNVTHANLTGDFRVRDDCDLFYHHTGYSEAVNLGIQSLYLQATMPVFDEYRFSSWNNVYTTVASVNTPSGWEYYIPHGSTYSNMPFCELRTLLRHIEDNIYNENSYYSFGYFPWGDWNSVVTNNFEWSEIDGVIRISYDTIWSTSWGSGGSVVFNNEYTIPIAIPYLDPLGYEDGTERTFTCGPLLGTLVRNVTSGASPLIATWFNGITTYTTHLSQQFLWLASTPGHEDYTGSEHPATMLSRRKPWRSHKEAVQLYASDIRYSAYQSTADALDSGTASLNTDIWQTLVKIPEISDQIPDFNEAVRLLSAVSKGVRLHTINQIVDFATELRLTHQFEWRPEFDLITSLGPKMVGTLKEVARLSASPDNEVVLRGRFDFTFPPGTFGYPHSRLITHSRVAVESSGFRYLDGLLSMKATGFSPLASTLWDLTPFSFAANWFTGVGPRIRDLESVALVGVMGIRCLTHSYLVESSPTTSEVEAYRIDQSGLPGSEPLKWRFFVREVSTHVPPPRIGAFDFRMPTRPPDWMTVGSLVWQVFL